MKHVCAKCDLEIGYGKPVIQMLRGSWNGAITPSFPQSFSEWHGECFSEFKLNPQVFPYRCESCGDEIQLGQTVSFFVEGNGTDEYSITAECRGEKLYTVNHYPCCP